VKAKVKSDELKMIKKVKDSLLKSCKAKEDEDSWEEVDDYENPLRLRKKKFK